LANHHNPGESEIALSVTKQIGAKEYIAWWCHCEQKQLFGKQAYREINAIECDPSGKTRVQTSALQRRSKAFLLGN